MIVTDAPWVLDQVRGTLHGGDTKVIEAASGPAVLDAVRQQRPDVVILDLQIGNMGAPAVCRELRHEEESGRMVHFPVVMLLDRQADIFMARRADTDAWLVKPISSRSLQRTVEILLAGDEWTPAAVGTGNPLDADGPREAGGHVGGDQPDAVSAPVNDG